MKHKIVKNEKLGEVTYTALNLDALELLDDIMQQPTPLGMKAVLRFLPVIHASAIQVHQNLKIEDLKAALTLEQLLELLDVVMEVSGIKVKPTGEAVPVATA